MTERSNREFAKKQTRERNGYRIRNRVTIQLREGNSNLNVAQAFQPANILSPISAGREACLTRVNGYATAGFALYEEGDVWHSFLPIMSGMHIPSRSAPVRYAVAAVSVR
ncbi:MAG: hypothetical protein V2B18_20730 [Pseudomonadota bacterium]